ncbi:hypothetical protein AVEN_96958-1, partial [Araneus ventricosus]
MNLHILDHPVNWIPQNRMDLGRGNLVCGPKAKCVDFYRISGEIRLSICVLVSRITPKRMDLERGNL